MEGKRQRFLGFLFVSSFTNYFSKDKSATLHARSPSFPLAHENCKATMLSFPLEELSPVIQGTNV